MHENTDSSDSARREDPVAKEPRFDRVTKEGKTEELIDITERGQGEEQAEETRKGNPTGGETNREEPRRKARNPTGKAIPKKPSTRPMGKEETATKFYQELLKETAIPD